MPRVGQARKRDANEKAIVDALEHVGAAVFRLNGAGIPDLLVAYRGHWLPMEVKSAHGKLTARQAEMLFRAGPIPIVRSVAEALALIGVR